MARRIVIIQSSPRTAGNTATVAKWVAEGAENAGAEVRLVQLASLRGVGTGCSSCYRCQQSSEFRCFIDDDISELLASLANCDMLVLATPVYFFSFCSQLRSMLDRMFSLLKYDENGEMRTALRFSKLVLVATAGGDESDSGIDSMRLNLAHFTKYSQLPEAVTLFFGGCDFTPISLRQNAERRDEAIRFGRELTE